MMTDEETYYFKFRKQIRFFCLTVPTNNKPVHTSEKPVLDYRKKKLMEL